MLQPFDATEQHRQIHACGLVGQLHQRDLEEQARVGRVPHLDEHLAEALHRAHDGRSAEPGGEGRHLGRTLHRQLHELGRHQRQEAVAQVAHDVVGERARIAALLHGERDHRQGAAGVVLDERFDELVERCRLERHATACRHQLQRRHRVASRTATLTEHRLQRSVVELDAGVSGEPADVLLQHLHRQQVELQVLGAAPDRVAHLLRIRGGEHEHDMRWRLLQRLQECRLGGLGEHVDLVEDVHLVPAGRAERGLLDEVAHRVDTVVARGIQFVDVVTGASLDGKAGFALATRFAVDRALAVEHLGEDPGRAGLPRAARAREQVRLPLAVVDHSVAQCAHHVLLTLHLTEAARSVAAVERLRCHRCDSSQG